MSSVIRNPSLLARGNPPRSPVMRHFMAHIADARQGTTIKQIAKDAGVDEGSLSNWATYGVEPRLSDAEAVMNALGLTIVFMPLDHQR